MNALARNEHRKVTGRSTSHDRTPPLGYNAWLVDVDCINETAPAGGWRRLLHSRAHNDCIQGLNWGERELDRAASRCGTNRETFIIVLQFMFHAVFMVDETQ